MPAPATRRQLLARLHCIRKEQGWGEDAYRDIIQARTRTATHPGFRSAGDMPGNVLARLVAELGNKAGAAPRPNEWAWVDTAPKDCQPLLRKLIVLAGPKGLGIRRGGQIAYIEGIARQMAGLAATAGPVVKPLRMCDHGDLWRIVAAVNVQVRRKEVTR